MKTSYDIAISIILEIEEHGVLRGCKSFSELHDHCDANALGCQGEEWSHYAEHDQEAIMERLNEAQNMVDFWIHVKDNDYFNLKLVDRVRNSSPFEIASEIADLTSAIHDFKEKMSEWVKKFPES